MQMERRRIGKEYLAIVWGWPTEEEWTVEAPILRQGDVRPSEIYLKQTVHPDGVPAVTRFRVEQRVRLSTSNGSEFSVVRAFPETGRMHQIRVHLAHSGHSVVGDKIYGPDERCYLEFIQTGWTPELANRLLLSRHALHSAVLRVEETGEEWFAPLAPDLSDFLREGSPSYVFPADLSPD